MPDDRSSYLYDGGSVNGLYPSSTASSRSHTLPASLSLNSSNVLQGEIAAMRHCAEMEASSYHRQLQILTQRCSKAEERCSTLLKQNTLQHREIEKISAQNKQLSVALGNQRSLHFSTTTSMQTRLQLMTQEKKELAKELEDLSRERQQDRTKMDDLSEEIRGYQGIREELQKWKHMAQAKEEEARKVAAERDELLKDCEQLWEKLREVGEREAVAQQSAEKAEGKLAKLDRIVSERKKQKDGMERQVSALRQQVQQLQERNEEVSREKEAIKASVEAANSRAKRLQQQSSSGAKKSTFLQSKVARLEENEKQKDKRIEQLLAELKEAKGSIEQLKQRHEYLVHIQQRSKSLGKPSAKPDMKDAREEVDNESAAKLKTKPFTGKRRQSLSIRAAPDPAKASDSDAPEWMKY